MNDFFFFFLNACIPIKSTLGLLWLRPPTIKRFQGGTFFGFQHLTSEQPGAGETEGFLKPGINSRRRTPGSTVMWQEEEKRASFFYTYICIELNNGCMSLWRAASCAGFLIKLRGNNCETSVAVDGQFRRAHANTVGTVGFIYRILLGFICLKKPFFLNRMK